MNVSNPRPSTEMSREPNGQGEEAAADPIRQLYFSIVCDQSLPNKGCAFNPLSSERPDSLSRIAAAWPSLSHDVQVQMLHLADLCKTFADISIEHHFSVCNSTGSSFRRWLSSKVSSDIQPEKDKGKACDSTSIESISQTTTYRQTPKERRK